MEITKKEVKLVELFYDLLFVYAISKLTGLISEPVGGFISHTSLFIYIITSFVILQGWLYFTNYVNRYGQWRWHEYLIAVINMISVMYLANTINTNWIEMALPFNISMLIMLVTVLSLYVIQSRFEKIKDSAANNSISILSIVCLIYIIALVTIFLKIDDLVIWIDVVAVLCGAFLPFFIKGKFDKSIINFPHLVERFELLTIITFGEAVVGISHFFDVTTFNITPILVFLIIISMFGFYVVQIHELMEHMRIERSLRLMFSHYFIVISINLVTVAFEWLHTGEVSYTTISLLTITSLIIFYISSLANKEYYSNDVKLLKNDIIKMILVSSCGILITLIFTNIRYGFYLGILVMTIGNFLVIYKKYKKISD